MPPSPLLGTCPRLLGRVRPPPFFPGRSSSSTALHRLRVVLRPRRSRALENHYVPQSPVSGSLMSFLRSHRRLRSLSTGVFGSSTLRRLVLPMAGRLGYLHRWILRTDSRRLPTLFTAPGPMFRYGSRSLCPAPIVCRLQSCSPASSLVRLMSSASSLVPLRHQVPDVQDLLLPLRCHVLPPLEGIAPFYTKGRQQGDDAFPPFLRRSSSQVFSRVEPKDDLLSLSVVQRSALSTDHYDLFLVKLVLCL